LLELVGGEERIAVRHLFAELRLDRVELQALVAEDPARADAVEARAVRPLDQVIERRHLLGLKARKRREEAERDTCRGVLPQDRSHDERARPLEDAERLRDRAGRPLELMQQERHDDPVERGVRERQALRVARHPLDGRRPLAGVVEE
jgi:hypothetical protein